MAHVFDRLLHLPPPTAASGKNRCSSPSIVFGDQQRELFSTCVHLSQHQGAQLWWASILITRKIGEVPPVSETLCSVIVNPADQASFTCICQDRLRHVTMERIPGFR